MMNAILTTAIKFQSASDVEAYKGFSAAALPEGDRRYSGVSAYKVGFDNIVLLDEGGYIIAKRPRKEYKGFAIDGEPVNIGGPNFKRIGCGDEVEKALLEVLADGVERAIAEGFEYRVAWVGYDGETNFADFKDSTDAEVEYEARLKTEQAARIEGLNN